jgi:Dockerin type I domain
MNGYEDGNDVTLSAAVSLNSQGQTVVTLEFSGAETDPASAENGGAPSLADGLYTLTILASNVDSILGHLDGAGTGTPGNNYVSPTDTLGGGAGELGLFRLFGDTNGDGVVDQTDLGQFRGTFNASTGNPAYLSYLDADNSGTVDQVDLGQFRSRFNASVF